MRRLALLGSALVWLFVIARMGTDAKPVPVERVAALEPAHEAPRARAVASPAVIAAATTWVPSHPRTVDHAHLAHVQALLGALNDALDLTDPERMRTLLDSYDALEPEDPQRLREGYERIADCLEAEDEQSRADARANAERYYQQARASVLRRHVRRQCLEPRQDI